MCRNHSHIVADRIAVVVNRLVTMEVYQMPHPLEVQVPSGGKWTAMPGTLLLLPVLRTVGSAQLAQALMEGCFTCLSCKTGGDLTHSQETETRPIPYLPTGQDNYSGGDASLLTEME